MDKGTRALRILLLTDRFPPEVRSAARIFHELALELQRRGHDVAVIAKAPRGYVADDGRGKVLPGWSEVDGVRTFRVRGCPIPGYHPILRGLDHLTLGWTFRRACQQFARPDIILVQSPPLPLALSGGTHARRCGGRLVLNVQDLYPKTAIDLGLLRNPIAIKFAERMERRAYREAARIVVHSMGNREFLKNYKGVAQEKVSVIHNWVNTELLRPGPRDNDFSRAHGLTGKFVVSYAGLMGYAQDLTTVIESARRLIEHPDILFLLVGEGVLEPRWRQAASGLVNVRFLPLQPEDKYIELLAASDLCLVPLDVSLRTPAVPGKLQSIMASGRPVITITGPESDAPKLVMASGGGVNVSPGDAEGLADTILRLKADPATRTRMGARGRAYAEEHFSLLKCTDQYEELFAELKEEYKIP